MEPKIPKSIKQQVIKQWLQGTSKEQIAKNNRTGTQTLSCRIRECKKLF